MEQKTDERVREIRLYRTSGKTLKDIGKIYKISRQRVYQILYPQKNKDYLKIKIKKIKYNKFLIERKKILYHLLKFISPEEIKQILLKLVIFNQGISPIENFSTNIQEYKDGRSRYRELVRKRDKYTCQLCRLKWEKGKRKLDTHHIDGTPEDSRKCDNNFGNMITLCHQCHLRIDSYKISKNQKSQ